MHFVGKKLIFVGKKKMHHDPRLAARPRTLAARQARGGHRRRLQLPPAAAAAAPALRPLPSCAEPDMRLVTSRRRRVAGDSESDSL